MPVRCDINTARAQPGLEARAFRVGVDVEVAVGHTVAHTLRTPTDPGANLSEAHLSDAEAEE